MEKRKENIDLIASFMFRNKQISIEGFSVDDLIYRSISVTKKFYEIDLLKYIKYVLSNKKGVIIDIGANIGNHSVFFGLFVSKGVICFEPNKNVLPILKRNLLGNGINYKIFELGLSDEPGHATVEIPVGQENNVGAAKLLASHTVSDINVSTLDILLPQIKDFLQDEDILAIKIDVEGMEPNVLNGGVGLISTYKPEIFVEIVDENQMRRVEPILKKLGYYKIVSYAATPVWHFSHKSKSGLLNTLLIKSYILRSEFKTYSISLARRVIRFFK